MIELLKNIHKQNKDKIDKLVVRYYVDVDIEPEEFQQKILEISAMLLAEIEGIIRVNDHDN